VDTHHVNCQKLLGLWGKKNEGNYAETKACDVVCFQRYLQEGDGKVNV